MSTHWRTGTRGSTVSTSWPACSVIRRPPRLGQNPRPLHEKGTRRSNAQLSQRTRAMIDLAAYAVMLPLMAWITYALWLHLAQGWARNERSGQSALNLPVWPFRVIFMVAFFLLALQILAEVFKAVRRFRGRPGAAA